MVSHWRAKRFTFTLRPAFWVLVVHSAGSVFLWVVINAFCKSVFFKVKIFPRLGVHKRFALKAA